MIGLGLAKPTGIDKMNPSTSTQIFFPSVLVHNSVN